MTIQLSDKLQRAMFNGRTLGGKFRRGWWLVGDAKRVEGCPEPMTTLPNDAKSFWYNGCLALYINTSKELYINTNCQNDELVKELADVLKTQNDAQVFNVDLGKATRAGAKRDLESLLAI